MGVVWPISENDIGTYVLQGKRGELRHGYCSTHVTPVNRVICHFDSHSP